jgi:hypothetical protein
MRLACRRGDPRAKCHEQVIKGLLRLFRFYQSTV